MRHQECDKGEALRHCPPSFFKTGKHMDAGVANKDAIHVSSTQPRKRKNLRKDRVDQAISEREVNHGVDVKNTENA
jgi:hypothetical protein